MNKIFKTFFLLPVIIFSLSLKANCVKWQDDLIADQRQQTVGNAFPTFKYKSWANHEVGGTLEEKSTADIKGAATFVVVPGAFTPTCTNKHINEFVEAYNNENDRVILSYDNKEDFLRDQQARTPTFIVAKDTPDVIAAWAKKMGSQSKLLNFISDPSYELMEQLGVLESNPRLGLIGKRSVFYVKNGKILDFHVEKNNAETCVTSLQKVKEFWNAFLRK